MMFIFRYKYANYDISSEDSGDWMPLAGKNSKKKCI